MTAVQTKFACGGARTDVRTYELCQTELEVVMVREFPDYHYGNSTSTI